MKLSCFSLPVPLFSPRLLSLGKIVLKTSFMKPTTAKQVHTTSTKCLWLLCSYALDTEHQGCKLVAIMAQACALEHCHSNCCHTTTCHAH